MDEPRQTAHDPTYRAEELIERVHELLAREQTAEAIRGFEELHAVDQARVFGDLSREQQRLLLEALSPTDSGRMIEHLRPEEAAEALAEVETEDISSILDETDPDVAVDVLKQLPEERLVDAVEGMKEAREVIPLLEFGDESAGGVMTSEFLQLQEDLTAANALDSLRVLGKEAERISSLLVVDRDGRLTGSLGPIRLALARPAATVGELMDPEITSVTHGVDREDVARLMERYDLHHLAVVDDDRRPIGLILLEDVIGVLEEEATEDMYMMTGIRGERLAGPLGGSVRRRLPWLFVNLATTIAAALVIGAFESTIAKTAVIAVFLPVVAGNGGIVATQTLTLMIRSMATGDVPRRSGLRLLGKELFLVFIHGAFLGVAIGLLAYAWKGNVMLGVVVGIAMIGTMPIAGLAGAATPLVLRALRVDPAAGSAVIVTTVTDVTGFLLLLGLATILISYLL